MLITSDNIIITLVNKVFCLLTMSNNYCTALGTYFHLQVLANLKQLLLTKGFIFSHEEV